MNSTLEIEFAGEWASFRDDGRESKKEEILKECLGEYRDVILWLKWSEESRVLLAVM